MRLALLLVVAAAPMMAGTLPSGLSDPLADAETCQAFAAEVGAGGEADLQAIAFMEGRTAHGLHSEDAKTATDLLNARYQGNLDMTDEAVAVYVEIVCRSISM
jgi:hypothetical protein